MARFLGSSAYPSVFAMVHEYMWHVPSYIACRCTHHTKINFLITKMSYIQYIFACTTTKHYRKVSLKERKRLDV